MRCSKVFAGNVRKHRTLAGMLEALAAPAWSFSKVSADFPRTGESHVRLIDIVRSAMATFRKIESREPRSEDAQLGFFDFVDGQSLKSGAPYSR